MRLHAVGPTGGVNYDTGGVIAMQRYITDLRIAGYSPVTIKDRSDLLERFRDTLPTGCLLDATGEDIRSFQERFVTLAPASSNIYARHLHAFYTWAAKHELAPHALADSIVIPRVPKGRPHPTTLDDLKIVFACATGGLRLAYALAAFAGLRRGEICRLQRSDLDLSGALATALVNGKGAKQRTVPVLAPLVAELYEAGLPRTGWVVRMDCGKPYRPERLSVDSHYFLEGLGIETTLHSMRGTFATQAARITHDPLFVRDVLGHESVATTEVYMQSHLRDAHLRLAGLASIAEDMLDSGRPVRPSLQAVEQ